MNTAQSLAETKAMITTKGTGQPLAATKEMITTKDAKATKKNGDGF